MNRLREVRPGLLTVVLTAVAGYVDAIGYLHLGRIYLANMSGNSVAFGIHGAWLDWPEVWKRGWPILSYAIGLLASRLILTWGHRTRHERATASAFLIESIFLAAFLRIPAGNTAVFMIAFAMGVQAAAVARFGGVTVYTCFVTGTLVRAADELANVVWAFAGARGGITERTRRVAANPASLKLFWLAANWIFYVVGAGAGALILGAIGISSVWIAAAVILGYALLGFRSPKALDEIR